ncbi:MAG: trigger factor [Acidobacteria bacterium]|nr:trigger factor [Acidobacteriota bacterium]
MKTELVDVNETRRQLTVEIPVGDVESAIERVTREYTKSARLPGFRPGRVPPGVVRQRFRAQILHDVAHDLIPRTIDGVLSEQGVEPVDTPDVKDVVVEEGKPLSFTASFDIVPAFEVGDFGDIQLTRPPVSVDDDTVQQTLERLRERAARYEPVEGGVAEGHTLVIDLERRATSADGVAAAPDNHEKVSIEIGAPANPPGFDAEVAGLTVGESRSFTLSYPADYVVAELAGTSVGYTVHLKELRRKVVPELDDEFAKDLGEELDSLEALRARVRADLEAEARDASERQVRADLLKQLAKRLPFPVPGALIDREIDRRVEDFARRLMSQQIDPRRANIDWAAFRLGQREPAQESVASALVLDQVARTDSLTVSDADLAQELDRYAERSGLTPAAVKARLEQEDGLGRMQIGLRREMTVNAVLGRVQVAE